jgi:23S rRNA pseudouridine1911/1915/1917 synthase
MIFSSVVSPAFRKAVGIVDYLAGRFTYHDREGWRGRIAAGAVTCNGRVANEGAMVAAGDTISYDAGEFEEPAADLSYRVIYEDEWLLGVDKPGNLLVHRAGRSFRNNLIYQLRFVHVPPCAAAHVIHRLDRDTSGVVLVAKNAAVKAAMGLEFAGGRVKKRYRAIVHGCPAVREIDYCIGKLPGSAISYKYGVDPAGKSALTRITASRPLGSPAAHALLTVEPLTGRTHQIRVHCVAIGSPIVGDKLYGLSEDAYLAWRKNPSGSMHPLEFHRHALHCASLLFTHPFTKKECLIEAAMPADMKALAARCSDVQVKEPEQC